MLTVARVELRQTSSRPKTLCPSSTEIKLPFASVPVRLEYNVSLNICLCSGRDIDLEVPVKEKRARRTPKTWS